MIESAVGMAASGGVSAILGAGISLVGKVSEARRQESQLKLARSEKELEILTASMNAANERGGPGGVWIRRFMVVAVFAFLFAVLPFNGILQQFVTDGVPATFAYIQENPTRFFGLFGGKSEVVTVPIAGITIFKTFLEMGWLMACFYFGSSRIK